MLSKEYPETLTSIVNLSLIYRELGRWPETELLDIQVKEARRRELGEQHPDTLANKANLV